ncbi:hypothetical protein C8J57DRAFT_1224131 [Mycena rebaudengoi]|nr:hypothetical protein C8J57DRAFT_1224131 [Mycena rebaudengoi]
MSRSLKGETLKPGAVVVTVPREDIVSVFGDWSSGDRRRGFKTLKILDATLDGIDGTSRGHYIMEQNVLNFVKELLGSRPTNLYQNIFSMLENLASHESTAMAILHMIPLDLFSTHLRQSVDDTAPIDVLGSRLEVLVTTKLLTSSSLVAIFCDSDIPEVVDGILWLLSRTPHIKFPPVTTGVSIEAKLLDHIVDRLKAPNMANYRYLVIFQILSNLALHESETLVSHESTAMAILRIIPLDLFSTRLRQSIDDTPPIDELAMWWEGLVTAELLHSPRKAIAEATCSSLVVCVCDMPQVTDGALWVLSLVPQIQFPPVTAGVSFEAKLLGCILDMLQDVSSTESHHSRILQIILNLASFESTALAIVEANTLNYLEKRSRSPTATRRPQICCIFGELVSHRSTATAVLEWTFTTCWRLSGHPNGRKRTATIAVIDLLTRIARWREGAEGMAGAKVLNVIPDGLHSLDHQIRPSTYRLLQELVRHESTVQAVITTVPREDIKAFSRYGSLLSSLSEKFTLLAQRPGLQG